MNVDVAAGVVATETRASRNRAIAMSAEPPMTILMPTSSPITHAAVPGKPAKMMAANTRSTIPLASIQPQRPVSSRR